MPSFDIVKEITAGKSFKIEQVKSGFDLQTDHISEHFKGDIAIEGKDWNIGLIVGRSGTGKTTIAKEVFPESFPEPHIYGSGSIIDEMPEGKSYKEITKTFTSVGFSSPPSWLKPYHVLSNGEKMRVDLAYAIMSDADPILFDEFTSVVDRDIAKICSYAISKSVRKMGKKFIAVSCHDDIIDWLEPDWVYDTNSQTFSFRGYQKTRPEIKIDIYKCKNKRAGWDIFRKYHYLNTNIALSTDCYIAYYGNKPVSFCSLIRSPHPINKKLWRVHRWVTLPDYQGVGIGSALLNAIAEQYKNDKWDVRLVSSQINVTAGLKEKWIVKHMGRVPKSKPSARRINGLMPTSYKRVTTSMQYVGDTE